MSSNTLPEDPAEDPFPCERKQVVPLLLAWHASSPELPDLARAELVSEHLRALRWATGAGLRQTALCPPSSATITPTLGRRLGLAAHPLGDVSCGRVRRE